MGISVEEYRNLISKSSRGKANPNPKRQILGKSNRELGKLFEEEVQIICDVYESENLARIEKTPEPMKILKHVDEGRFEAVFEKSAQPDFKGTIKGGRSVVFDAKYTESDRINYAVLKKHQRDILNKYQELGAMAFILVGFGNGKIYKIDIDDWSNMKAKFGRQFILQSELDEHNYGAMKNDNRIADFLRLL